jgi:molecular chaperone GrpE (heat shock protein)
VPEKKREEFKQFFDGLILVNEQVKAVLNGMGVEPIKAVGEVFDPNFHEAVSTEERDDVPVNTILDEMLRGYKIGNRVIRHSMVKVTTGQAAQAEAASAKEPPAEAAPDDASSENTAEAHGDQ